MISTCIWSPTAAFTPLLVTLQTPFSLPCHSLLYQLSSRMFSHHCNPQRRGREVGWPIHMKYSVCLPPLLVQNVPQDAGVCLCGVLPVSDRTGEEGERGSSSSVAHSTSLPVNIFDLKLTFQILPVSVLEDTEIAAS